MRSASLFAVVVLAVLLAASMFSPVAAPLLDPFIDIFKVTTNGDTTTMFHFDVSGPFAFACDLTGGTFPYNLCTVNAARGGDYTVVETVPPGWVLKDVACTSTLGTSTFTRTANGVTVHFAEGDEALCTFTNSPAEAVGGVVIPANTFALVTPWLAVIGLVGCISTAVVIRRKRHP
jgi:hypothetical protein